MGGNKYKEIVKSIKRLQNGDVSSAMQRMGISYKINYGVSIPLLRRLANNYEAENTLAFELLNSDIREAKLLASMLFVPRNLTLAQLAGISIHINNIELVENFAKMVYAPNPQLTKVLGGLNSKNSWFVLLALYAASWHIKTAEKIDVAVVDWGIRQLNNVAICEGPLFQKAAGFLLLSIAGVDDGYNATVVKMAEKMSGSENISVQKVGEEFLWLNVV